MVRGAAHINKSNKYRNGWISLDVGGSFSRSSSSSLDARGPNSLSMSLSLSLKLKKRGNVGARDSEWKKSAPIRGNK